MSGGTASFSYSGSITKDNSGFAVDIQGKTGGTVAFSGAISQNSSGATGINLNNNGAGTGATINFSGTISLTTGNNAAFIATGGGTVTATASNSALNSGNGTALNVANSTIGSDGLTFRSISSSGGSAAGIIVQNTAGSPGTIFVTGSGSAGSGGTIANKTGANIWSFSSGTPILNGTTVGVGVYLNNASAISLTQMQFNDFSNAAISSFASSGFSMSSTVVSGSNGSDIAQDESALFFYNPSGAASITGGSIAGGLEDNLHILKQGGVALNRFTVSGGTVFGFNNTASGNNNILLDSQNVGTILNFTLQGCTVRGARADWINAGANSGSTMDLVIGGTTPALGNTFDNLSAGSVHPGAAPGGNRVVLGSVGTMTFDINNNILKGSKGEAIRVRPTATGALTGSVVGNVRNNTIGVQGTANSGSSEGSGIFIFGDGGSRGTISITGNSVFQYNNHGIRMDFGDEINNGAFYNVTITGNTVNTPGNINTDFNGIALNCGTVAATDNFTVYVDIGGAGTLKNNLVGSGSGSISPNNQEIRLRQRQSTTVRLPGYSGANNDNTAVVTYLQGRNTVTLGNGAASNTSPTGGGFVNGGLLPLLFAPGGVQAMRHSDASASDPHPVLRAALGTSDGIGEAALVRDENNPASGCAFVNSIPSLIQSELDSLVTVALDRWTASGLTGEQLATLRRLKFEVASLPGSYLGEADGNHIRVDNNAGGNGWFIGSVTSDNAQFGTEVSATRLYTDPESAPAGRIDLLTAIMHEMGHALGLNDSYAEQDRDNVMYGFLTKGERRLPAKNQAMTASPDTAADKNLRTP
jgi:hypothetical protein